MFVIEVSLEVIPVMHLAKQVVAYMLLDEDFPGSGITDFQSHFVSHCALLGPLPCPTKRRLPYTPLQFNALPPLSPLAVAFPRLRSEATAAGAFLLLASD